MSKKPTKLEPELFELRLLTKRQLKELVPYCDQHIRRLEMAGKFPKRRDLGDNRVAWLQSDIVAWIKSRPVREYPASDDTT